MKSSMTLKEQAIDTLCEFKKKPDCLCHIAGTFGKDYPKLKKIIQQSVDNYHDMIGYKHEDYYPLTEFALLSEFGTHSKEFYEARVIFMEELIKQL